MPPLIARLDPLPEVVCVVIDVIPIVKFSNMEPATKLLLLVLQLLLLGLKWRIAKLYAKHIPLDPSTKE